MINNVDDKTICAIATPPGGALGIVRVSGKKAIETVDRIFHPANKKKLTQCEPNTVTFGIIMDGDEIVDEVLVSLFKAPRSYTGEDCIEISCHGSSYILSKILQMLTSQEGCRMAEPGEYTKRAFMNGKMDLSQAEAVADLIASTSKAAHDVAMNQMRGGFSRKLATLREKLLHLTSLMELELDFSDHEDVEFANRKELKSLCDEIEMTIASLCNSFTLGNAIRNGIPTTIIGETNAGKSTLLNALLNEDKAIVSDIHGTTRDAIEDTVNIDGIMFRFIDTAGIRETNDKIENLGIERTYEKIRQSSIILWVMDASTALMQWERFTDEILPMCKDKHLIIVFNKCDLIPQGHDKLLRNVLPEECKDNVFISAKNKTNLAELQQMIVKAGYDKSPNNEDVIVTNIRHLNALKLALESIKRVNEGLSSGIPSDLVSQDLRECIYHLSDIAGDVTTDSVLKTIFERFCIGK